MQQTTPRILLLTILAFALSACGKSESLIELEGVVAKSGAKLVTCEGKKGVEMTDCITKVSVEMSKDWSTHLVAAANDDPKAIQALTEKMSALILKSSDMASSAY